ncbi:MAG: hypothetical protein IJG15_02040, partial [Lachnospiraceae bacterium]|nr:hypothetical protein [Lachnospiraceae bacterium]
MKRNKTIQKKIIHAACFLTALALVCCLCFLPFFTVTARADTPTDEIEHFIITVDVEDDASLRMTYHIDWKVLDDEKYGPLEWVDIGVPNSNHSEVTALSDNIDHINDKGSSLEIYLDRNYYRDEVASFEYSFIQDHMYQIDRYVEGETVFAYTPAWFDGIEVKDLTIRWNADKAGAWQPDCLMEDGYLVFSTGLQAGERYSMTVAYPNDAFAFSTDRQAGGDGDTDWNTDSDDNYNNYDDDDDSVYIVVGAIVCLYVFLIGPLMLIIRFFRWITSGTGFGGGGGSTEYRKKITRTKIEYYETCPGCGAGRVEGKDKCPYCGHNMIKSKEIVEEKDLEKPETYSKTGTYRYGSHPNTYIHVNVVNVPVGRTYKSSRSGPHSSGKSHSSRSSSCACACACA